MSDFFFSFAFPKSSPLLKGLQQVKRECSNLILPSDTCSSKVKAWVPLRCQPQSECHFYQSNKGNINHSLVMET